MSDELAARLHRHFSDAEIVELAAWVALENFRSRFNAGLGLRSQGFCREVRDPRSAVADGVADADGVPPSPDADAAAFEEWRPLLFGIAYRMLGSATDAEDMVQEACLRWLQRRDRQVESVRAYLVTIVTRLCIDQLASARVQRVDVHRAVVARAGR